MLTRLTLHNTAKCKCEVKVGSCLSCINNEQLMTGVGWKC